MVLLSRYFLVIQIFTIQTELSIEAESFNTKLIIAVLDLIIKSHKNNSK